MLRKVVPLVLLAACLNPPREKPWYAQVLFFEVIDARYDDAGLLHVLYAESDGWHLGTIDHDAKDRGVQGGPLITVDGGALGVGPNATRFHFSIAIQPGSDAVWLYADGLAGPVSASGAFDPQIDLRSAFGGQVSGTIGFLDEGRLLVSGDVNPESTVATSTVFPVSGSTVDVDAGTPFGIVYNEGQEPQPLYPVCHIDVADGFVYFEACQGGTGTVSVDGGRFLVGDLGGVQKTDLRGSVVIPAVNDDGGLATLASTPGELCVLPWDGDDHTTLLSMNRRYATEGICQGADAVIPMPPEADVHPSSQSWVGMYPGVGVVLMDERRPKDAKDDLVGTWCSTVSVDGLSGQFTLGADHTLTLSSQNSEILHPKLTWSQSGDRLVFHYAASDMAEEEHPEHWAVRVGDTLHIKSGTSYDDDRHRINAGYTGLTGLWTYCSSPQ